MQNPSDHQAEVSIPAETLREGPNRNRTFTVRRRAAKRSESWYLEPPSPSQNSSAVPLPPSQQAEGIPAKKKRRLEEPILPLPTTSDEDARKPASTDTSVGLPPPAADHDDASTDIVADTQPNAGAIARWTLDEDALLTSAFANTPKKKRGNEPTVDWIAIAVLVPGRTKRQCWTRWHYVLDPSVHLAKLRTGKWTADEDSKLTGAVQRYGGKNWIAIAALVPGRVEKQCYRRWRDVLDPGNYQGNGRPGSWTEDEAIELTRAVQSHGNKDWDAIAALFPNRTKGQCKSRWHHAVASNIGPTTARTGIWTKDEDSKLKVAVERYGSKGWRAVATLVPGRTKKQCYSRWNAFLTPGIDQANERTGKWTEDEDRKLKAAVERHGGKQWPAVATFVLGRTTNQCWNRWKFILDPTIVKVNGRAGKWTEDEDSKLKVAVERQGGKDWIAVAALVPGRSKKQCYNRWNDILGPSSDQANGRTGSWTEDEDSTLKVAVERHGGRDWPAVATLVPGRTKSQCWNRWNIILNRNIVTVVGRRGSWTEEEDSKLKVAVEKHGGKDWIAVATHVPGRTKKQCYNRWNDILSPSVDQVNGRKGKWTEGEENKLKNLVEMHGDKDWAAISALVRGRTKKQCSDRWKKYTDPNQNAVQEKALGTLNKVPALGQEHYSP